MRPGRLIGTCALARAGAGHWRPQRRRVVVCVQASTSTSTSRRRRSARSAPASRSARTPRACCTASGSPRRWRARACGRWPGTSGAGTTAARCCARRSAEPLEAAFGFPHYQMHRADLLAALAARAARRAAASRPPADRPRPTTATASRRGSPTARRVEVDVLVGADGIHSPVRAAAVRARAAALHRLRRLSRAGAGRAAARPRASRSRRRSGWGRAGTSCTTSSAAGGW